MEIIIEDSKVIAEFLDWKYIPSNNLQRFPKAGWYVTKSFGSIRDGWVFNDGVYYKYVCRNHHQLRFYNDYNLLFEVVEKIEKIDCSSWGYSWQGNYGKLLYNNVGIEFSMFDGEMSFDMQFQLDPSRCIHREKFEAGNRREKLFICLVETIKELGKYEK